MRGRGGGWVGGGGAGWLRTGAMEGEREREREKERKPIFDI